MDIWPFSENVTREKGDEKMKISSKNATPKDSVKRVSVVSRKSQIKAESRERAVREAESPPPSSRHKESLLNTPSSSSSSRIKNKSSVRPVVIEYDEDDSDVDLFHGTDTSEDWSAVALAPGILAKTLTNIIGMSALGVGVVVGKMGSASPVLNNGGLANSTAFRMGYNALLAANGIFPRLQGEETDFRDCPLLVSNHISYIDGLVLATVLNVPKIIVKDDVRDMPIFGKLAEDIDAIFVKRSDKDSKKKVIEAISDHVESWKKPDRPLLIFPEGKTYNGRSVGPFRKGAFVCGKPVRPIVLLYTGNWDPSCPDYRTEGDESVEFTDGEWGLQFMGHLYHSIIIHVMPIYEPSEEEIADPELYANNVHEVMTHEYLSLKYEHEEQERRANVPWVSRSCVYYTCSKTMKGAQVDRMEQKF